MKPLVVLDFDGVLFNSAYEAYRVCEATAKKYPEYAQIDFDEFMEFRRVLTDAWQFNRLYSINERLRDFSELKSQVKRPSDELFAERFFAERSEMMKSDDWPKLMSPYPVFFQIKDLIDKAPQNFRILSTRNVDSIKRTLDYFGVSPITIFGQEHIRKFGSKLAVAHNENWVAEGNFVVYVDDMMDHLKPFTSKVGLCLHAGWGYDPKGESYSPSQVVHLIESFLSVGEV